MSPSQQSPTCVLDAVKNSAHEETVRYRPYTIPEMKMTFRFQVFGIGEATTRSLERAIMAPSLNTASNTINRVGKYLQSKECVNTKPHPKGWVKTTANAASCDCRPSSGAVQSDYHKCIKNNSSNALVDSSSDNTISTAKNMPIQHYRNISDG